MRSWRASKSRPPFSAIFSYRACTADGENKQDLGISLLIAESNLVNAARIVDRLYAIDRGEIIFEGKPQQALEDENVMRARQRTTRPAASRPRRFYER